MSVSFTMRHVLPPLLAVIVAGPLTWMALDRAPPVTRTAAGITPDPVRPGETVTVKFTLNTQRDCPGIIRREIIDAGKTIHRFEDVQATYAAPDGNRHNFARELVMPRGLASGPAVYRSCVIAACNPIHYFWPIQQCEPVIKFTVIHNAP